MSIRKSTQLIIASVFAVFAGSASADLIFDLSGSNLGSGFTGPFAHVDIHVTDATHATATFTSLTNGGFIYLLAGQGAVALNINGSFTLGTITGSNSQGLGGFTPGPYSNGGAGNENGFGSFNQTIDSFDGFQHSSTTISFALTGSGTTWTDATILTGNSVGNVAAAHVFACAVSATHPTCLTTDSAMLTGYASSTGGGGPPNEVPEPQTLALLGLGLFGLALIRRQSRV